MKMTALARKLQGGGGKFLLALAVSFPLGAFADVALSHRWNFNDSDYTDSVGGSANGSVWGGTRTTFANGQVNFSGGAWGWGSVDLGKSLTDGGDTTIEIWAKNNALSAAEIMFEYGAPNNNYGGWGGSKQCFAYYWSDEDAQGNDIFIVKKGNYTSYSSKSDIMSAAVGTMYHFSFTFKADGNGGTVVNFARRNATTGAVEASGTLTVADWTLSHLESQTPSFSLNISKEPQFKPKENAYNGSSTRYSDSNATYDEVRIWKGVLSEDQLTANVLMGVDAPPTAGITVSGATGCTLAAGERFTIKGGGASIVGSVTLSSTSAIVFDTSSYDGLEMSFTAQGGFSTPGNASILDFVSVTDTSRWSSPVLSADGKTITVSSTSFPYTWTGAVNSNWTEPGNWKQGSAVATTAPGGDDRVEFANDSAVTVTLDSDATVSNVVFAGSAAVTLANPNAASTNTLTVTRFVNTGSAEAAIECKVAFTGTYDVRQNAAVRFTGGATASVPEPELRTTYETELNRTFYGNVTFTNNITVAGLGTEKPWIVPSGSVVNGQAIAGTQGGHGRILLVAQGGVANFTSLTMGWDTGDFEIHGELNVSGTVTHVCHNGFSNWSSNCFRESSTGVVRMNGFYKQYGDVDDVRVESMVIGSGGISYNLLGWPIRFAHNSTIRAAADFGIQNAEAYSSGDTDDHGLLFNGYTVTFNTEGEDGVAHTVTLGSSIRNAAGVLRKTGAGTLILQDGDRDTNTGWTKKYTGGTVIEAGTVQVLDNGQLGSGAITVNGGILEIGEGVTLANAVSLANGTTLKLGGGLTVGASVTGSGAIQISGEVTNAVGVTWTAGSLAFASGAKVVIQEGAVDGTLISGCGLADSDLEHFEALSGELVIQDGNLVLQNAYVWNGGNGDWNVAGNWLYRGNAATSVPGASDNVKFVNTEGISLALPASTQVKEVIFAGSAPVAITGADYTLTATKFINTSSEEVTLGCRVAFTGTYDVRQSAAVRFTGGATASVPEPELRTTYETELNRTFYGNVTFTNNITVAGLDTEKPWIVPSGSVVNGQAITGTQGGHGRILLVEQGGVANFTSLTMGWDTGDFEIHGELNVSGTVTHVCHNGARGWSSNCFRESNTGVVRMNGFYKQHGDVDDVRVETMVIGSGGISYSGIGWPIRFAHNSTIRAAADFGIQNAEAYSSGDTDDHGLNFESKTVTFNTEGEDGVAHTITLGSSIRNAAGVLRKTGAGTLILQDGDRDTNTGWTKKYTGGTVIEAGTVQVLDNGQLGSGAITVNGGILEIGAGVTNAPAVTLAEGTTLTVDVTERSEAAAVALTATGGATVKVKGTLAPGALRNGVALADSCDDATLTNLTLDASQINNGRLKLAVKDGKLVLGVRKGLTIVIR